MWVHSGVLHTMLSHNRLSYVALGLALSVLSIDASPAQTPKSQGMTKEAPAVEGQSERKEDRSKKPADPLSVRILEDPIEAQRTKEREERSKKHDDEDLEAQQRAAEAAERSAIASERQLYPSWAQTALVAVGTAVLIYTLLLTRAALAESRRSSEAALFMAKVIFGIELPIIQSRWIGIHLIGLDTPVPLDQPYNGFSHYKLPTKHSVISSIPFRNYGRTPAFLFKISLGFSVTDKLLEQPVYIRSILFENETIIRPEPEEEPFQAQVHFGIDLGDAEVQSLHDGMAELWLYCAIMYRDFLNQPHEARCCWRWAQRSRGEGVYSFRADGSPPSAYTQSK